MHRATTTVIVTLTAVVGLGACGNSAPSASDWAADVSSICTEINTTRSEIAAKHLPSDAAPTRDQLMAFFAEFGPEFRVYGQRLEDVDRPDDLDGQIDELVDAYYDVVDEVDEAATDPTAAQAQLDAEGDTDANQTLNRLGTDLGLTTCVA